MRLATAHKPAKRPWFKIGRVGDGEHFPKHWAIQVWPYFFNGSLLARWTDDGLRRLWDRQTGWRR